MGPQKTQNTREKKSPRNYEYTERQIFFCHHCTSFIVHLMLPFNALKKSHYISKKSDRQYNSKINFHYPF